MFIDSAKVMIRSGHGGSGCVSFHREKFKPRGGPDGGNGGKGGDVTFVGDQSINSLVRFRYSPRLFAEKGRPGSGNNRTGRSGKSLTVKLPCGTIVRDAETGDLICEIIEPGVPVTVALGGIGGKGNQHFATSTNKAPRFSQEGLPGMEFNAILELKIMADVGLVGLPNAGKSSLITAVSHAAPKIGSYPFTTLNPVVGVIDLPDYRTIVMADIPGIIEGAADGRGLGIQFLKHVERTKVLLFVIDVSDYADTDPVEAFNILFGELEKFGHGLEEKEILIAANKTDLDPEHESFNSFLSGLDVRFKKKVFAISSATRDGLDKMVNVLEKTVTGTNEVY